MAPALAPAGQGSDSEPASATTLCMLSTERTVMIANEAYWHSSVLFINRFSYHMDGCSFLKMKRTICLAIMHSDSRGEHDWHYPMIGNVNHKLCILQLG